MYGEPGKRTRTRYFIASVAANIIVGPLVRSTLLLIPNRNSNYLIQLDRRV